MAQIRLRDFNEPLTSFNHNIIQMSRRPGRFIGFDTMVQTDTLKFNITHQGSNRMYKNEINESVGPIGILLTTQGVIIIETEPIINLEIQSNTGNSKERIDLLICNHQFVNITGGQVATYSIIKGPINDFVEPALTNPDFQTVVGRLVIPANAADLTNVKYEKARCPDSGDGPDARLNEPNKFKTYNQFSLSSVQYDGLVNKVILSGNKHGWELLSDGNSFKLLSPTNIDFYVDALRIGKSPSQDGAEIKLIIDYNFILRSDQTIQAPDLANGFEPIIVPSQYANTIVQDGNISTGLRPTFSGFIPTGGLLEREIWVVTLFRLEGKWLVINVQGNSNSSLKPGMVVQADLTSEEMALNFDETGLGIRLYEGFQLCNGLRNTLDRRCRFAVMASNGVPAQGADALASELLSYALGEIGNNDALIKLLANNLPAHHHFMFTQPLGNGFQTGNNVTQNGNAPFPYLSGSADTGQSNGYIFQGTNVPPTYGKTSTAGGDNETVTGVDRRPPFVATLDIMKLRN